MACQRVLLHNTHGKVALDGNQKPKIEHIFVLFLCMDVCVCVFVLFYIFVFLLLCVSNSVFVCIFNVRFCVYLHVCMHVHLCVNIYIYIYMHR